MKKTTFITLIIFGLFTPIIWSYIKPSNLLSNITYILFGAFFLACLIGVFLAIRSWLIIPSNGDYCIKEGKHYADGYNWMFMRNIKFVFFKRRVKFMYSIDPEGIQDDKGQQNKIFGITSILFRRNSVRKTFESHKHRMQFTEFNYYYDKGVRKVHLTGEHMVPDQVYYAELVAPRMIWFGFYHFPYHGGKIASQNKYSIHIKIVK